MDGLLFLASLVGIGLVMWWVLQNDRAAPDQPTRGLFAMARDGGKRGRATRAWRPASDRMPGSRRSDTARPGGAQPDAAKTEPRRPRL